MSQQPQGVLIAIDWENIRRGAQLYQRNVRPAELCRAMSDVGRIFGEVAGGKAFGTGRSGPMMGGSSPSWASNWRSTATST